MARKPMITRTIISTKVNVLCLDLVKCEPFNKDFELAGTYKNDNEVMKAVTELMDTSIEKPVHVTLTEKVEQLYGMSEQDFISRATPLNADRKPIVKVTEAQ